MASWGEVEETSPSFAAAVRARFETHRHHVLATLRRDGSPRVTGTEVKVYGPDLTIGSMPQSMKARDLLRDGRYALHANPGDGSMEGGDAKVAGIAFEVTDPDTLSDYLAGTEVPSGPFHLFRLAVAEAVLTSLHPEGDRIVIETWNPGQELRRFERA
ncbi:MAG: pyridoxamine 5'-phosphate oxidase family protein [Acidimicrobiia bacterium]